MRSVALNGNLDLLKAMKNETLESVKADASPSTVTAPGDAVVTMAPPAIQLKNILVPLDFSEMSLKSLQYAVPFARQFGAKITLLHIDQPADDADIGYPMSFGPEDFAAFEMQLEQIRATKIPMDVAVDIAVRHDLIFDGVLEVAREIRADLIITTTHGYTGVKHLVLGSTAENIVRRAPCPVLVVREMVQAKRLPTPGPMPGPWNPAAEAKW
jgi:universal stress protein A